MVASIIITSKFVKLVHIVWNARQPARPHPMRSTLALRACEVRGV